jgi:hypothetical protein
VVLSFIVPRLCFAVKRRGALFWTWPIDADTVATVDAETLDRAVRVAAYAAAGEMQREIADARAAHVTEADLRRAVRAGAQAQLGPVVIAEVPTPPTSSWTGRLGAIDVGLWDEETLVGAIEVKWCRQPAKLAEALWDALKLVGQTIDDGHLLAAYLIYGAPDSTWDGGPSLPGELFTSAEHDIRDLLARHDKHWRWLLTGAKSPRPAELRSRFATSLLADVPIRDPHSGESWSIRCVSLKAMDARMLFFDDGLIAADQPAFGPPAPASRFSDTAEDIQTDQATLPENVEIRRWFDGG